MDATQTLEDLVHQVQHSCLNYKIELSPFSATILLKKSFITDKSGQPCKPQFPVGVRQVHHGPVDNDLVTKVAQQESVISTMKADLEHSLEYCEEIYEKKTFLEKQLEILSCKVAASQQENSRLRQIASESEANHNNFDDTFNTQLKNNLLKVEQENLDLKARNRNLEQMMNRINKQVSNSEVKADIQVSDVQKEFKR